MHYAFARQLSYVYLLSTFVDVRCMSGTIGGFAAANGAAIYRQDKTATRAQTAQCDMKERVKVG